MEAKLNERKKANQYASLRYEEVGLQYMVKPYNNLSDSLFVYISIPDTCRFVDLCVCVCRLGAKHMDKHTLCLFSGRKCNGMRAVIGTADGHT